MINKANVLELAVYMDRLPEKDYDQSSVTGKAVCIACHICKFNGYTERDWNTKVILARNWLGIIDSEYLFINPENQSKVINYDNAKPWHAAAVLRHLAATGKVDWSFADNVTGPPAAKPLPNSLTNILNRPASEKV